MEVLYVKYLLVVFSKKSKCRPNKFGIPVLRYSLSHLHCHNLLIVRRKSSQALYLSLSEGHTCNNLNNTDSIWIIVLK